MSTLVEQLLSALQAGVVTKFSDLSQEQLDALHAEFNAGPFTPEQRQVLDGLVFLATQHLDELDAINEGNPRNQIGVFRLVDDSFVIPVDAITNAYPGERFAGAYALLVSLPVRQITAEDIPLPEEES